MYLTTFLELVKKQLNATEVNALNSFKDDLGADSLDMVELVIAIEDTTGVDMPDELAEEDKVALFYSLVLKVILESEGVGVTVEDGDSPLESTSSVKTEAKDGIHR